MGYYTSFSIAAYTYDKENDCKKFLSKEAQLEIANFLKSTSSWDSEFHIDEDSLFPLEDMISDERRKWYDWEEDMREVAEEFPDIYFILYGEGEDSGDIWKAYFKEDSCYIDAAKIIFKGAPQWMHDDAPQWSRDLIQYEEN